MISSGLTKDDIAFLECVLRSELGDGAVGTVWLFGSRAKGTHSKYSDIDLLIECDKFTGVVASRIAELLEESNLPYKVDIVDIRKLASAYAPSVMQSRKILFELG